MMIVAGGVALLPGCVKNIRQVSIDLKNLKVTPLQEDLLAEITETIIPATETPGAKNLRLHEFVLRMVDDCFEPEQQQKFLTGLSEFDGTAEKKYGDPFVDLDKSQQETLIKELEAIRNDHNKEVLDQPVNSFYAMVKGLAVHGYMTSEYVMTNQLYYNMVPGGFKGCVEVTDPNDYKTILG